MSVFRDSFEQCPRCGIELVDAGSARGCSRCQGLWLREDILTEMVTAMLPVPTTGRLVFAPTVQDQRVACPSCRAPMVLTTLAEIVVDRCAKHGVWFDREELEQVLRRSAKPSPMIGAVFMEVDTSRVRPPGSPPGSIWPGVPVLRFEIVRKSSTRVVDVQREIIKLGRSVHAHVMLDEHSGAARMHAVIEAMTADAVTLIDLGSKPGTWVNGAPITKTLLHTGDVIVIGDTSLTLEIMARSV